MISLSVFSLFLVTLVSAGADFSEPQTLQYFGAITDCNELAGDSGATVSTSYMENGNMKIVGKGVLGDNTYNCKSLPADEHLDLNSNVTTLKLFTDYIYPNLDNKDESMLMLFNCTTEGNSSSSSSSSSSDNSDGATSQLRILNGRYGIRMKMDACELVLNTTSSFDLSSIDFEGVAAGDNCTTDLALSGLVRAGNFTTTNSGETSGVFDLYAEELQLDTVVKEEAQLKCLFLFSGSCFRITGCEFASTDSSSSSESSSSSDAEGDLALKNIYMSVCNFDNGQNLMLLAKLDIDGTIVYGCGLTLSESIISFSLAMMLLASLIGILLLN